MPELYSNFSTLAVCWGLWSLWLSIWRPRIDVLQPGMMNWLTDTRNYQNNTQRSRRNSRRGWISSQIGSMTAIDLFIEWLTLSKKTKMENEAMDAAHDRIEQALIGLRQSNAHLTETLRNREILVREQRDG